MRYLAFALTLLLAACKGGEVNDTKGGPHGGVDPNRDPNAPPAAMTSYEGTWCVTEFRVIASSAPNQPPWPGMGKSFSFSRTSLLAIGGYDCSRPQLEKNTGIRFDSYHNVGDGIGHQLNFSWSVQMHPRFNDQRMDIYSFGLNAKSRTLIGQYTAIVRQVYNGPQDTYRSEFVCELRGGHSGVYLGNAINSMYMGNRSTIKKFALRSDHSRPGENRRPAKKRMPWDRPEYALGRHG